MYKDSTEFTEELFMEAKGIKGALAEVILKCKLLKSRSAAEQELYGPKSTDKFQDEVDVATEQMHTDLARYRQRLDEIYEELEGHGIKIQ